MSVPKEGEQLEVKIIEWAMKYVVEQLTSKEKRQLSSTEIMKHLSSHYAYLGGTFNRFGITGFFQCTNKGLEIQNGQFKPIKFFSWKKLSEEYVEKRDNKQIDLFTLIK